MSETPPPQRRNWRWKWKKRKPSNKSRFHQGGKHQRDNNHHSNHPPDGDEKPSVATSSSRGQRSSSGSGHFDDRIPGASGSGVSHQKPKPWNTTKHCGGCRKSRSHSSPCGCIGARGSGGNSNKQARVKSQGVSSGHCSPGESVAGSSGGAGSAASTSSGQPPATTVVKEIPGFYYDSVKKRYFRLLPGHNNFNPLTRESIEKKEAEKKRLELLNDDQAIGQKKGTSNRNTVFCPLQRSLQTGQLTSRQFMRFSQEHSLRNLDLKPRKLANFPDQYFDGESGDISFLQVDECQQRVLMVLSHDYLSRMWQGTITPDPSKPRSVCVSDWKVINIIGTRVTKVTSASWVSCTDNPDDLQIIYSISGGPMSSVQLLRCPREGDGHNHMTYSYESNHESAWTCTWSNNPVAPSYLSIGSSNKAIVVDTVTAYKWKVFTNHSDVLAQVFSTRKPVLYNGTRRGEILGCDLRSLTQTRSDITLRMRHKVAVCSIRLLKDENYMVASDMSGQVKLWDLRQCLCVQEFKGHNNQHAHLPISVDSTEKTLYGVGQDSYTRLWSLHDATLLRTIPCPQPPSHLSPSAIFSQEWKHGTQPGLLLGVQRNLYWYPL
ncbi:DDB1- and CUL4-associated factor 4-like [Asterias rubens]|uniref:DDB1- and CUL4-associated factor 4-like n=1 Tax=Asterias rubens TaxID=7604 RepID=UPI001455B5F0|nr:DDB1- and CUL4-associated factor 4-like [Asterias rubens]